MPPKPPPAGLGTKGIAVLRSGNWVDGVTKWMFSQLANQDLTCNLYVELSGGNGNP